MNQSSGSVLRSVAVGGLLAGLLCPAVAGAYDSHDFTTTASTAGTTAYIVGKHHDSDFAAAHRFAKSQRVALQREAAAGGGEDLMSLAALMGVSDPQAFGHWMQVHYGQLYSENAAGTNLVDRITALHHA